MGGDTAMMGKQGTDIENGKCSWLIVQALQRASLSQRETLAKHYGVEDASSSAIVKATFDEMRIRDVFREFESAALVRLQAEAERLDVALAPVGRQLLQRLFKRSQ